MEYNKLMETNYSQTRGSIAGVKDPLIRHVNLTINNPTGATNINAEIDVTYDTAILQNCGENLCTVMDFSLPMQNLPLFVFPIEPNQGDRNLSTLDVGVCHNMAQATIDAGTLQPSLPRYTESLNWIPQKMGVIPLPTQNVVDRQVVSPYYYCYSYEHFVNMVNEAVQAAHVAAGNPGGVVDAYYPKFAYDDGLKTFSWTLPSEFTGNTDASTYG